MPAFSPRFALLTFLQALIGVSATLCGLGLVADPSGAVLGMSPTLLVRSPFETFLIPGLVLTAVVGLGHLVGATLTLTRRDEAVAAALCLGVVLCGWIGAQWLWLTDTLWLQPVIFCVGLSELGLALVQARPRRDDRPSASAMATPRAPRR